MENLNSYITAITIIVNSIKPSLLLEDEKMNGNKKFKEIYDKFGGSYGDLIVEHIKVLKELENCRKKLNKK
jgi:hypothetical protein